MASPSKAAPFMHTMRQHGTAQMHFSSSNPTPAASLTTSARIHQPAGWSYFHGGMTHTTSCWWLMKPLSQGRGNMRPGATIRPRRQAATWLRRSALLNLPSPRFNIRIDLTTPQSCPRLTAKSTSISILGKQRTQSGHSGAISAAPSRRMASRSLKRGNCTSPFSTLRPIQEPKPVTTRMSCPAFRKIPTCFTF